MRTTTLVHLGDFHAAPGPRNAERYATLDQIIAECEALPHLGAWLWPGDLFDGLSTIEDRNALDLRIRRMAGRAPVIIVYGNHDRPGDLDGFAHLSAAFPIHVIDRPQVLRPRLATGEHAAIFCVPYPHKAGLVGSGVAHGDIVDEAGHLFEPVFVDAAAELARVSAQGALTACVFHANVAGAVTSAGQPHIGKEIELTHALLDRLGGIYKGGNHIHRPQEIAGAWYAGSITRKDYGEIEPKRYLLIHYEQVSQGGGTHWHFLVESRPIDIPPMYHVEGRLTPEGFALAENSDPDVVRRYEAQDWRGCDVRVQYRYDASARAVLDEQVVRDRFASALRLKVQGVAVPDREVRSVAVARARTLAEKLAAMRPDGVLPASVADKVAALEQQDREQVIASVRAWLESLALGPHDKTLFEKES